MSACDHHPHALPADPLDFCECAAFALAERSALIADGCKLPQRCEEAERLALECVRREWSDPRAPWGGQRSGNAGPVRSLRRPPS